MTKRSPFAVRDSKDGSGCHGGRINSAFEYIQQQGGIDSEESYPYEGEVGACRFNSSIVAAMIRNFSVVSSDVNQVAANLVKNGPLAGNQPTTPILEYPPRVSSQETNTLLVLLFTIH